MADRYACSFCGTPATPDPSFTIIDPRYAKGKCPKCDVIGQRLLVREDVEVTVKKRRK